tara:strand:- start:12480 stop:13334 length:855 start_codon:yes stop_codon:yes gene_type:complete
MKPLLTIIAGASLASVFSTGALAQSNDAMSLLLDQIRELRAEVQTLRGMVEEHGYDIQRMQQDSLDRYTDLDSRISTLFEELDGVSRSAPMSVPGTATAAGGNTAADSVAAGNISSVSPSASDPTVVSSSSMPATQTPAAGVSSTTSASPVAPTMQPGLLTEQQLYELALDALLQQQAYQQSITQFDQYLQQYPSGRFVTNAHYWKGQAYVNLSMFQEARGAFETIINDYPDGRKIEDAMYSLGTVYHQLGDITRARQMLQDVRTRFPNTSAANLADIYLRTLN